MNNVLCLKLQLLVKIYVGSSKCIILWGKLISLKQYLLCTQQNKLFLYIFYLFYIYFYLDIYFENVFIFFCSHSPCKDLESVRVYYQPLSVVKKRHGQSEVNTGLAYFVLLINSLLCENNVHLFILLCYWLYVVFLPWQGLNVWVFFSFVFFFCMLFRSVLCLPYGLMIFSLAHSEKRLQSSLQATCDSLHFQPNVRHSLGCV